MYVLNIDYKKSQEKQTKEGGGIVLQMLENMQTWNEVESARPEVVTLRQEGDGGENHGVTCEHNTRSMDSDLFKQFQILY